VRPFRQRIFALSKEVKDNNDKKDIEQKYFQNTPGWSVQYLLSGRYSNANQLHSWRIPAYPSIPAIHSNQKPKIELI